MAGGLGTRLQGVIGATPKCMAPIAGRPFLYYLLQYLKEQGCTRVILSLGYQHQKVEEWLPTTNWPFEIVTLVEPMALGTGGAILFAMQQAKSENIFVLNGDTMFRIALSEMLQQHQSSKSAITLALKYLQNSDRYGLVEIDEQGVVSAFLEKQQCAQGFINGGLYLINRTNFLAQKLPQIFSFERDFLEKFVATGQINSFVSEAYFIDIGVPHDFEKAQIDFATINYL